MMRWTPLVRPLPNLARIKAFLDRSPAQAPSPRRGYPVGLVFRRPIRAVANHLTYTTALSYAPRVDLHLERQESHYAPLTASTTFLRTVQTRVTREIQREVRLLVRRTEFHRQTVERREARNAPALMTTVPITPLQPVRRETPMAYPRLSTPMKGQGRSGDPQDARPAPSAAASSPWGEPLPTQGRRPQTAPETWTLPAPEMARLTSAVSNQVISQLERRALSFRERSGRV